MKDEQIQRLKAFVLAMWMFTVTSLSAYHGKRGLDPKVSADPREAEDEDPGLQMQSSRYMGAIEEEVVARRLVAMKAQFWVEGDRRLYTGKPGVEPMDDKCVPVTACRACKNAGWGVKHQWFQFSGRPTSVLMGE